MKKILSVLLAIGIYQSVVAQSVGIGTTTPNVSAQLDITSTTKGFLPPRMTTAQRNAIVSPTAGLIVFDISLKEFYHYDGGSWRAILNSKYDYWNKSVSRNWVYNNTDSIGVGTTSPDEKLHIVNGSVYIQDNRSNQNPHVIFDVPAIDGNEGGLQFKRSGDTLAAINYIEETGFPNYIRIGSGNAGKHNDFTVNTNGEIGIGTRNPFGQMQLSSYSGDNLLINDADGIIQFSTPTLGAPVKKGFIQLSNGNDLRLGTNASNTTGEIIFRTNNSDQMAIDQNGEIGIGTLTPVAKLHILDGEDAGLTLSDNGYIMLGNAASGANLLIDNNEIMAREGFLLPGTLNIQHDGGEVTIGARTTINKDGEALKLNGSNPNIAFYQSGVYKSFIEQNGNEFFIGNNAGDIRLSTAGGALLLSPVGASVLLNPSNGGNVLLSPTGGGDVIVNPNSGGNVQLNPTGGGQVAIGTVVSGTSAYKLTVTGKVLCEELKVKLQSSGWPDYVFDGNYKLPSLPEVEKFISLNKHLPNIPSAIEVEKNGIEVGDMQKKMIEKIEELTLYVIELQKQIDSLRKQNN